MFTTPQKPWQRRGASGSPSKIIPLNGLFVDGIWHCNCTPRLPASNFQVKKQGPNNGRWFYTCQQSKDDGGCGFFLWKDDAMGREMRTVVGNSRSEPERPATPTSRTTDLRSPASNSMGVNAAEEDDEFGDWSLSPDEEKRMAQAVERATAGPPSPETPRKAIKTSQFVTPGSKRKLDEHMLPTPSTGGSGTKGIGTVPRDEDVFTTPSSRFKGEMWDGSEPFGLRSPSGTPTPTRYRESTAVSESQDLQGIKPSQNYDISEEVCDLLKDQNIDEETMVNLKKLLSKHAMKISGIAKGRDITRVALKAKDSKIAELQQRISALEAQREIDRTVIRHFKSDMSENIERRRGRGRGRGRG